MNEATWKIKCNNRKIYPGKVLSVKENITNSELIAKKVKNFFTETVDQNLRQKLKHLLNL